MANFIDGIINLVKKQNPEFEQQISLMHNYNNVLGSPTKLAIINILSYTKEPINKSDIYIALQSMGISISYKNVLWNLDQLKKEKIITFKRVKADNNSTYIILDKEKAKRIIKQAIDTLEMFAKEL